MEKKVKVGGGRGSSMRRPSRRLMRRMADAQKEEDEEEVASDGRPQRVDRLVPIWIVTPLLGIWKKGTQKV